MEGCNGRGVGGVIECAALRRKKGDREEECEGEGEAALCLKTRRKGGEEREWWGW